MKAVTLIALVGLLSGGRSDKLEAIAASNSYLPPPEASSSQADYEYFAGEEDYGEVPDDQQAGYGEELEGRAAEALDSDAMNLKMLMGSVPGTPGEDYPIYATAPDTDFSCEDKVAGGYYADPAAECQAYHICGAGYARLCPNGTIFNQEKFICDWWFNFDCGEAESFYGRNDEIAAEREAQEGAASDSTGRDSLGEADGDIGQYGEAAAAAVEPVASYLPPPGRRGRKSGRRGRKNVAAKLKKSSSGKFKKNKRTESKKKGKGVRERSRNGKSKKKGSTQRNKNKSNLKTSRKQKKSDRSGRRGKSGQNRRNRKARTNVSRNRKNQKGRKGAIKG